MGFGDWLISRQKQNYLRQRILSDPYYRLQSTEEIAVAASLGIKIDPNRATVDDWLRLPGLSIHQARSLVSLSRSGVQFHCLEDVAAALSWPSERLKPLAPILSFCYYDPESVYTPQQINPNTASVEMLSKIPAIDTFLAQSIVQNRQSGGYYRDLADLQIRLSLPADTIAQLMHYFRF
ncbi:ComEA family DNA-binding protein [Planktothrix sp. FACHB-1355]|uniref:ComEA family DNA-binding protein n=1 Tax=Aerosakkonema funiforme FACHB-1375 TaxID=2949571 RepID=A0A926VJV7_9CYAN|nr:MULTISPECIES: ComEA family DNA-binding protein [Oscillatoriales]MBD2185222.1 ComEA family DNA-binding protein [Aerosakkonema funiforme FACHB-1375]MBD3562430.1 ComEA family DNA-binding protein [Planktothrix sp. FACHB-1355]